MATELPEIGQIARDHLREELKVDFRILVDQHVAQAHREPESTRELVGDEPMGRESLECLPCGVGRSPAVVGHDVICEVDARLDGNMEPALHGSSENGVAP